MGKHTHISTFTKKSIHPIHKTKSNQITCLKKLDKGLILEAWNWQNFTWVTSAEVTHMTTTVSIRNNPALYLHPITKQLHPDEKNQRNWKDPHVASSDRFQNHPSTHQFDNPITRTTPWGSTIVNLCLQNCVRRLFCREGWRILAMAEKAEKMGGKKETT